MGIHYTDVLSAAQFHIASQRSLALKIEIANRHREEMSTLVERHAREKEANAADIETARTSYFALVTKISEDASATKKAIEETVARQAALMIEAQVSIPNLMIDEETSADEGPAPSEPEAGAPSSPTGKKRGRKSNAEKAAEAAAAAAAALAAGNALPGSAPADETSASAANETTGDERDLEESANDAGDETEKVEPDMSTDDLGERFADEGAESGEAADSDTGAGDHPLEATPVSAEVVESLVAGSDAAGDTSEVTAPGTMLETTSEATVEATQDSDFAAHSAASEASGEPEEELDGFAALDALSTTATSTAEEEFEVPSFLRA